MKKDYKNWCKLKEQINARKGFPTFREREIWWCSIGVNIGHEEDGKNTPKQRPVLIIKKFNYRLFAGIPLTTQIKEDRHYHKINFKGKEQCLMLSHIHSWDAKRLSDRMGTLNEKEFEIAKQDFKNLL